MGTVVELALYIGLVLTISFTRNKLVFEFGAASLLSTGSQRAGLTLYAILTFPGTVLHELSHWITAELLGVPTGPITLIPQWDNDSTSRHRLGSVTTAQTDPFRGFLIGLAPLLTGTGALVLLGHLLNLFWQSAIWWQTALVIYALIVFGNSMLISREDRRFWPIIAILLTIISTTIFLGGFNFNNLPQLLIIKQALHRVNQALGLTIGLNLAMICGLFLLRRLLEKSTGKKIINKRS